MVLLTAGATLAAPRSALAAGGDIFREGTRWCASTHPNHGTLDGYGPALDLGAPDDAGWPIYAPGKGRVRIHSRGWGGGWGNSVIWISGERAERIHLAHLASFAATGRVEVGALIGRVGSTGRATSAHVHASARRDGQPARLMLGGRVIEAGSCYASRGPIPPTCFGREATHVGTRGDDILTGTSGDDVIVGRGGDDLISGRGGDDRICGGGGADELLGGPGADRLAGGAGEDLLYGGRNGDHLRGDRHSDQIFGGRGPDVIEGGEGDDRLDGGPGLDLVTFARAAVGVAVDLIQGIASGDGEDTLVAIEDVTGSNASDVITGDAGPNRLRGLAGDDTLDGGGGEDVIDGGDGVDTCTGEIVSNCEGSPEP
jgi:hypothetical protein